MTTSTGQWVGDARYYNHQAIQATLRGDERRAAECRGWRESSMEAARFAKNPPAPTKMTAPHCSDHWQFESGCIECSDAIAEALK